MSAANSDIDRIMLAAMAEYEEDNPEEEESFKRRWAKYRNRIYMREYLGMHKEQINAARRKRYAARRENG